jgi:hypothetical protein
MNAPAIVGIIALFFLGLILYYVIGPLLMLYIDVRHGETIRALPHTIGRTLARPFTTMRPSLPLLDPGKYDPYELLFQEPSSPLETLRPTKTKRQKPLVFGTITSKQLANIQNSNTAPTILFAPRSLVSRTEQAPFWNPTKISLTKRTQNRRSRKNRQRIQ